MKFMLTGADAFGPCVKLTLEPTLRGKQTTLEADVVLVFAGQIFWNYAIGDVIPGPMLAQKAAEDGVACVELITGEPGHVDYDTMPGIVYTRPGVASVGKKEEQVKVLNISYAVGKFPFVANSRARTVDDVNIDIGRRKMNMKYSA
ncbi:hypothetical protein SUGI_0526750 [Cryptomeria japonica]|nr:hypothetical protein SUGI_0526750 [Cryptomeria japonica]